MKPLTDVIATSNALPSVRPSDLRLEIKNGGNPLLLDVRRLDEYAYCHLPDSLLIPLHELETRLAELDSGREIVVYCHHGVRSAAAVRLLQRAGFTDVRNLTGGIHAWSFSVDPTVPTY